MSCIRKQHVSTACLAVLPVSVGSWSCIHLLFRILWRFLPPPPPLPPPPHQNLVHFALRPQKRDGLLGTGTGGVGGGGTKESRHDRGYRPKKTGETVDRRQNNGSVKAVSPRHCPATSAPRNCCFNCRAWAESQGQCPLHRCWGTTRSERSSTFAAQLHLPTRDLFWANLRSSSTSLLLISWSFDLTRNL